jgi:putative heme iron utilization protein
VGKMQPNRCGTDYSEPFRPDRAIFGLLLNLSAKCSRTNAGEHAEAVLRDMQENGVAAITVDYNNVILAHPKQKGSCVRPGGSAVVRNGGTIFRRR